MTLNDSCATQCVDAPKRTACLSNYLQTSNPSTSHFDAPGVLCEHLLFALGVPINELAGTHTQRSLPVVAVCPLSLVVAAWAWFNNKKDGIQTNIKEKPEDHLFSKLTHESFACSVLPHARPWPQALGEQPSDGDF